MLQYPTWLSPEIFSIGPVTVRWYGMMYLLGFLVGRVLLKHLIRKGYLRLRESLADDFLIWLFVGMVIGARTVSMLVYYRREADEVFHWWTPFAVWQGGLAFHGAVIGMCAAIVLFARRHKLAVWNLTDVLALVGSQGILWGRIGNFINIELLGRPTSSFLGMKFPVGYDADGELLYTMPVHPSQLYQAVGEGLLPFVIIWLLKPYIRYQGVLGGIWLCLYAVARFFIEFTRQKDAQLPYYFGWMTMGQILCAIQFLVGLVVIAYNHKRAKPVDQPEPVVEPETTPA